VTLQRINNFMTDQPPELGRQLSRFEDNAGRELDSVRAASLPKPTLSAFTSKVGVAVNRVTFSNPGQLSIDSGQASVNVLFPKLTTAFFGLRFTLIRRSSLNSVICACLDTTVSCQGSLTFPTFTGATPRVIEFYCDSSGYYYQ
jgi:hypothetical protein